MKVTTNIDYPMVAIAGLIKSWDVASDRLRVIRNRPLPGSLRPVPKATKTQRTKAQPVEAPTREVLEQSTTPVLEEPAPKPNQS